MLVLHIGLAKTGTTFLQYKIFAQSQSLVFLHRKRSKLAFKITRGLRAFGQAERPEAHQLQIELNRPLKRIETGGRPAVVSDENVAVGPRLFWAGRPAAPEKVARRIALLQRALSPPELLPLKALVGIREQDQWLASCYAEASLRFPSFNQADFNRRMADIADLGDANSALGWLDYRGAREALANTLGREERSPAAARAAVKRTGRDLRSALSFFGGIDLLGEHTAEIATDRESAPPPGAICGASDAMARRSNSIRGSNTPCGSGFAASNRALANEMPLGFGAPPGAGP